MTEQLELRIRRTFYEHNYLLDSNKLKKHLKKIFATYLNEDKVTKAKLGDSIRFFN
ncbi:hypothetical protein MHYMCMPSP_00369 [Hyalomma marginatum]|uniref:Uncharacterized protein n=1 Tax=Hyalomma marginatum TaxID=34627 RepID=A0A8S4C1J2_9ACAR|nr:hypothetical protein MHYMCMPASI_00105 [Hyalomma marginatum]CAG7590856.1 hypothetical protein MHYMCMPSP_00369 [Hyalomma marginatum]